MDFIHGSHWQQGACEGPESCGPGKRTLSTATLSTLSAAIDRIRQSAGIKQPEIYIDLQSRRLSGRTMDSAAKSTIALRTSFRQINTPLVITNDT